MKTIPGTSVQLQEALELHLTPVSKVKPDPRNPRRVKDLTPMRRSLEEFGCRRLIVANLQTGLIEVGHQMFAVLSELGATHVPVLWVDDDDMKALAYNITDNRTSEIVATWDAEGLSEILEGLECQNFDMSELGFTEAYKNALFSGGDMDLGLDLPGKGDSDGVGRADSDAPISVTVYFLSETERNEFAGKVAAEGLKFTISGGQE